MKLLVALEVRFLRGSDGHVYSTGPNKYEFWQRYLSIFDRVVVLARVGSADKLPPESMRADGERVEFVDVPDYHGLGQYLLRYRAVRATVRSAVSQADACILRLPGTIGSLAASEIARLHRGFAVEVVGDPYDVFSPGTTNHLFRPAFRRWFTSELRKLCLRAKAVAYVTSGALQHRYPAAMNAFTTHYSSIRLTDEDFAAHNCAQGSDGRPFRIITIGTLEQLYKAQDILIDAVSECGLDVEAVIVGDGQYRRNLERRAASNQNGRILFAGHVTDRKQIHRMLDEADLFVLPSRQEGLPRAMIEAMARSLPCVGSTAGGIPELLSEAFLVPPNSPRSLAEKITWLAGDAEARSQAGIRNHETAKAYRADILDRRRSEFYYKVRESVIETGGSRECTGGL